MLLKFGDITDLSYLKLTTKNKTLQTCFFGLLSGISHLLEIDICIYDK